MKNNGLFDKLLKALHYLQTTLCQLLEVLRQLWTLMKQPAFWLTQLWQVLMLPIIIGFWWFQGVGVDSGTPAPPAWIISALLSIIITARLTAEIFMGAKTQLERYLQGMLLVQYLTIIPGNTIVVVMELVYGVPFTIADLWIGLADLAGLLVVIGCIKLGWFDWKSPWAKCGYAVSLKVDPQFWTAFGIFMGWTMLGGWVVFFLVVLGFGRLLPALGHLIIKRRAKNAGDKEYAQFTTAAADQLSIFSVAACVIARW